MTISLPIFSTDIEPREATDRVTVALTSEDNVIAGMEHPDPETNAANALLFSASPKLFFALRDIVESTADLDEPHREAAHVALREATEGK